MNFEVKRRQALSNGGHGHMWRKSAMNRSLSSHSWCKTMTSPHSELELADQNRNDFPARSGSSNDFID